MVFTLIGELSDDEFSRFTRHLDEEFTGKDNVGKNLVLTGEKGTEAKPYSLKPSEMEFIEGNRELARSIALAFGVPPMLLGIKGDSTYNNMREARLAMYEDTTSFYLRLFRGEVNNWLFTKEDGLGYNYREDDIPALEPRQETKWKRAQESDFISINEKRKLTGYDDRGEEGNVILVDANKIPLSLAVTGGVNGDKSKVISLTSEERNLIYGMRKITIGKFDE
jgi:HK97 family phage portal protein